MQMLMSSKASLLPLLQSYHPKRRRLVGRRELCFDGVSSSVSPPDQTHSHDSPNDIVSPHTSSTLKIGTVDLDEVMRQYIPSTTRRMLFSRLFMYSCYFLSSCSTAHALGDPTVTVEQVKPPVLSSGALFPTEEKNVQLFEKNTYAVVNVFDVTLQPQLNAKGVVEVPEGIGSGVVWDEQGHIVTNYHVIGNSLSRNPSPGQIVARVNILASDGVQKNFEGKLVGADRAKDLAVLKVEATKDLLRPIKVGRSSSLKVGQQCLAIGNPFGFDHTLTVGVISGLNRDISSKTGVTIGGGIQTDAAINPGNSGGPLLDSKGNLIGINTAIFTQSGTSAGVGFAIPSSTVAKIVPQLIQFGKCCVAIRLSTCAQQVVRAALNVDIAPDLVANQLNVRNGALILQVPGNSSAARAGLVPTTRGFAGNIVLGDVIVAVDNQPVKNKVDLDKALDGYSAGDQVLLKVRRGKENLELTIILEENKS